MGFFTEGLVHVVKEHNDREEAEEKPQSFASLFDDDTEECKGYVDDRFVDRDLLESLFGEEADALSEPQQLIKEPMHHMVNPVSRQEKDPDAVTVISKGTIIDGSILSDASVDVIGTVKGSVECAGKLTVSGHVTGDCIASDIIVNTKRLEGNICCEGVVKIGLGTIVIGDIKAGSGVIAGAVKGEIDVMGSIEIDSTAIIKGNIKAKAVQMNNGAVIEGFCTLSYAQVDIDNIFE